MKPKIEFWVKIFHEYSQNQAIFHDAEAPEVIYSVISSESSCHQGRKNGPIELERTRIKNLLLSVQDKQLQANPSYTADEQAILNQMKTSKSFELDKAPDRIRCQNGVRDQFEKALSRYHYYKNDVIQILKDSNLPEDIQYLPFVESSYNPTAYSKVGAAGLWQIMPQTARVLGLKINASIDERLDPILATKAATRYFENSYQTLVQAANDNGQKSRTNFLGPFVITSYNYGIAGMKKALTENGPDFIDMLNNYKGKSFRVAVKNFYASFLAAKHLVTNESLYFQKIDTYQFPQYNVLNVPKSISATKLAQNFSIPIDMLRELNPMLTKRVWSGAHPIPQDFALKIPFNVSNESLSKSIALLNSEQIEVKIRNYKVQKGDSLCNVARMFEVSCTDLMAANSLTGPGRIRTGQVLTIPSKEPKELIQIAEKKSETVASISKAQQARTSAPSQKAILILDDEPAPTLPAPNPIDPSEPILMHSSESKKNPGATTASLPAPSIAPVSAPTSMDDPQRLQLSKDSSNQFYVHVEPEETLGHYSDWLDNITTQDIRRLNHIAFTKSLTIGQKILLPIQDDDQRVLFEKKRTEYHQTLEDGFGDQYSVIAFTTYQIKKGDNEWSISDQLRVPLWLIKKYNPTLEQSALRAGDTLNIPLLKPKTPTDETLPLELPAS